jgi:hypothetical protein
MSRDFSLTKQPSKQWFYGLRSYGMKHVSALQCQTAITSSLAALGHSDSMNIGISNNCNINLAIISV